MPSHKRKKTVLFSFGTRPEAIKMAPVIHQMKELENWDTQVLVSAQHRQMLDQVLDFFHIRPDFDLNLMQKNQTLASLTSGIIGGVAEVLEQLRPDFICVQGDTTTTMASALAAFYAKVPIGHIEAGLRSFNLYSPWPEEMNRRSTGMLSEMHFCPTELSRENLLREGISSERVWVTGNTVVDALLYVSQVIEKDFRLRKDLEGLFPSTNPQAKRIMVTTHRRESFGEGILNIVRAIKTLAENSLIPVEIYFPVHLNPAVQKPVYELLKGIKNIHLMEPLSYLPFIYLMKTSYLILSDSGGVQEEAPSFNIPVLVMRENSERMEGVYAGVVKLVGTQYEDIVREAMQLLQDQEAYRKMAQGKNPYGDGEASKRIVSLIEQKFSNKYLFEGMGVSG